MLIANICAGRLGSATASDAVATIDNQVRKKFDDVFAILNFKSTAPGPRKNEASPWLDGAVVGKIYGYTHLPVYYPNR